MSKARRKDTTDVLCGEYWLTRVVFLRCLGFVYAAAFLSGLRDNAGLLGEDGLLPATRFMSRVQQHLAHLTPWEKVIKVPTVFWFVAPTAANLWWVAAVGAGVSCLVAARGAANLPAMFLLWSLYHSLVNVGQAWYSFGWESQLLETGFLAMFLVPRLSLSRFPEGSPPPLVCVWGYRWLLFRIMLGAGLIKMRGDPCWRDLTCMDYHYQTQPNPNPLARFLHLLPSPHWHKAEVIVNHIVELVLPWCLLLTRRPRCFAGWIQILFQAALVASGNLSFLNWLTAVPAVFSFDDLHLAGLFRPRVVQRAVRRVLADTGTSSPGGGEAGGKQGAEKAPAPAVERQRREPGVDGEGREGAVGGGSGEVDSGGSGSGSGSGSGRPALSRALSTLQWSSESEDEGDEDSGAPDDDGQAKCAAVGGGGKSMPCAVATPALADDDGSCSSSSSGGGGGGSGNSYGQPRESFGGILRFRGRGGEQGSAEKPLSVLPSTPEGLAAAAATTGVGGGGGNIGASATGGVMRLSSDAVPGGKKARSSRGGGKKRPLATGGRVLRGATRALRWAADSLLVVLVVKGSVPVVKNMAGVGGGQTMNRNFDSLRIVNTYGNFGSVTKTRGEVVLKGTRHPDPLDPAAEWKEYDFRCKPGNVNQRPCVISPLHYRLDWQMWFAAFQSYGHNPWLVNLVAKLLSKEGETRALVGSLIRHDPFWVSGAGAADSEGEGEGEGDGGGDVGGPPLFIKADLYLYEFAGAEGGRGGGSSDGGGRERGAWWTRRFVREYLPPVGLGNPSLQQFLASHGLE